MNFENLSPIGQRRWVSVMVPNRMASTLPFRGKVDGLGWPWLLGEKRGQSTRIWVRADLGPGELVHVPFGDLTSQDPGNLGALLSSKLIDGTVCLAVEVETFTREGQTTPNVVLNLNFTGVHHKAGNDELLVLSFDTYFGGVLSKVYVTVGAGCDVAEVMGWWVWSRRVPGYESGVRFRLLASDPIASNMIPLTQNGFQVDAQSHQLVGAKWAMEASAEVADAMGVPFYACVVGSIHGETTEAFEAACGGPIVGFAKDEWASEGFGPHRAKPTSFLTNNWEPEVSLTQPRMMLDWRPLANAVESGTSGDQGCWGRMRWSRLFRGQARPRDAQQLRYSSTDYWLRSHHHLTERGECMVLRDDLGQFTYNGYIWSPALPAMGKEGYPPYGFGNGRPHLGRQWRGALTAPIAQILLGDMIMDDELAFLVQTDAADVRHHQGSWEASRSSGRLLTEWAWWYCSCLPHLRDLLVGLAKREVEILESLRCGHEEAGPVTSPDMYMADDPKNPIFGHNAWAPWQDSILCDGLLAWVDLLTDLGIEPELAHRCRVLARRIGSGVVNCGFAKDVNGGQPWACTWVKLPPLGQPLEEGYLTYPRAGAGSAYAPGLDMIVGGIGMHWYVGGIEAALRYGDAATIEAARAIVPMVRPSNLDQHEWVMGATEVSKALGLR